jgi:hypothetical protein
MDRQANYYHLNLLMSAVRIAEKYDFMALYRGDEPSFCAVFAKAEGIG